MSPLTGFLALTGREFKRFQKIWMDTVFSPIISAGLYTMVFGVALSSQLIQGYPYITFVFIGLLSMLLIQSAFSSPSFALIIGKNLGTVNDLLVVPLRPAAIGMAYTTAAAGRAIFTALIALLTVGWFIPQLTVQHPLLAVGAVLLTAVQFGLLGVVFGAFAKSFESLTFITSFVFQPLVFLGGTFFPVSQLPGIWATVAMWNPLHHNINLLRGATLGITDAPLLVSAGVVCATTVVLFGAMLWAVRTRLAVVQ